METVSNYSKLRSTELLLTLYDKWPSVWDNKPKNTQTADSGHKNTATALVINSAREDRGAVEAWNGNSIAEWLDGERFEPLAVGVGSVGSYSWLRHTQRTDRLRDTDNTAYSSVLLTSDAVAAAAAEAVSATYRHAVFVTTVSWTKAPPDAWCSDI